MGDRCGEQGWSFTYSTVQCHIKPLEQEKAAALQQVLRHHFPDLSPDQLVTVGDSPNDESLFDGDRFPLSVGVANVRHYLDRLTHHPHLITPSPEVEGFCELARSLLHSQSPSTKRLPTSKSHPSTSSRPSEPAERKIESIYTDGACSGNPGPGGWGTVVYFTDGSVYEMGGADPQTTNNRMEMQAAIAGLEFLQSSKQKNPITLYTDSEYVKNGITKWINGWKKKGWKTSTGKAVLNQELWEQLDRLNSPQVTWQYVRGHTGNVGNERCDAIARAFSLGRKPDLRKG
jgi:ribonuclease HI